MTLLYVLIGLCALYAAYRLGYARGNWDGYEEGTSSMRSGDG